MTDLYDERIDAMKASERDGGVRWESTDLYGIMTLPEIIEMIWSGRRYEQESRNVTRLAAYKRKRAPYDVCMCGEDMDKHTEGHGHTPVSMGDYHD